MWLFLQNLLLYSVTIIIGLLGLLFVYYKSAFKYWKKKNVPFPEPSFPFGNMTPTFAKYIGQEIAEIYQTMRDKGHTYCGYYVLGSPVFMPLSLELNKTLFVSNFRNFSDRGFYADEINDPMGANLATFSGEKWRRWRERLTPMFTAQKTKLMLPIVEKRTQELDTVFKGYIENGKAVPIQDIIKRYTVSVIASCAFGVESNCLEDPDSEFFRHANMIFTTNIKDNLRLAIGMNAPFISNFFKIQLFNPTAAEFFRRVVRESITYREENNIDRPDFLNLMMRLKHDLSLEDGAQVKFKNSGNEVITDDEIAAQCFVFYIGGFETTASVLSFALYELANNQDIQRKLREEIMSQKSLTYEAVGKMRYLDNIFHETMRKYPAVHMLNRIVSEDFQIPGTQTIIQKGTKAMVSILGVHRDPEYYPQPDLFDPDRFSEENRDKIPPFAYLPFGDGPRICPGMRFGIMEVKICLAKIIEKCSFSLRNQLEKPKICSLGNVLGTEEPILLQVEDVSNNNVSNNNATK